MKRGLLMLYELSGTSRRQRVPRGGLIGLSGERSEVLLSLPWMLSLRGWVERVWLRRQVPSINSAAGHPQECANPAA